MKMSFCSDKEVLQQGKRTYRKDWPFHVDWPWRDGFVLVCFKSARAYHSALDQCSGLLRFKARVHEALGQAIDGLRGKTA